MKPSLIQFAIALVVGTLALTGYGFWYAAISAKSAQVAELQNQIDTNNESSGRISAARTALTEIAGDEAQVHDYFISDADIVPFIGDLEKRGKALGTNINVLSVSTGSLGAQPILALGLAVTGTFDAVLRTVGSIEFAPYDLIVTSLSLGVDGKDSWHANMQITVGAVPITPAATSTVSVPVGKKATTTPATGPSDAKSGKPIPAS